MPIPARVLSRVNEHCQVEADHIKPYSLAERHEVPSELLISADHHRLFDGVYLTASPKDRRIVVSERIREEFENGRDCCGLQGVVTRDPSEPWPDSRLRIWRTTHTMSSSDLAEDLRGLSINFETVGGAITQRLTDVE